MRWAWRGEGSHYLVRVMRKGAKGAKGACCVVLCCVVNPLIDVVR
jgi:hypothetical protein